MLAKCIQPHSGNETLYKRSLGSTVEGARNASHASLDLCVTLATLCHLLTAHRAGPADHQRSDHRTSMAHLNLNLSFCHSSGQLGAPQIGCENAAQVRPACTAPLCSGVTRRGSQAQVSLTVRHCHCTQPNVLTILELTARSLLAVAIFSQ